MLDCIALGDSIAVGVGHARPDCRVMAVTGITSGRYLELLLTPQAARIAIISLGVNDSDDMDTLGNLQRLRGEVRAGSVYWMLVGTNPRTRDAARQVATQYGDRMLDVAPLAGPDHIHPDRAGYAALAAAVRGPVAEPATLSTRFVYRANPALKAWTKPISVKGVPLAHPAHLSGPPSFWCKNLSPAAYRSCVQALGTAPQPAHRGSSPADAARQHNSRNS